MDIQIFLRQEIARAKGLRKLARKRGVDPGYLHCVVNGIKRAGPEFLDAFGLYEIVDYRKRKSKRTVDRSDNGR